GPRANPVAADTELLEYVVQVPFHRSWAEEEPGADFGVRQPGPCELGDLSFLCGEIAKRRERPPAHLLAGRSQLDSGGLGDEEQSCEPRGTDARSCRPTGQRIGQPRVNLRGNARHRQLARSRDIEPFIGVGWRRMAFAADMVRRAMKRGLPG